MKSSEIRVLTSHGTLFFFFFLRTVTEQPTHLLCAAAVSPRAGEEAPSFAGSRTADAFALDDERLDAELRQMKSD